ncbi:MAG: hypothetical protein QXT86_12095 [Archaeoglobaceae archaeon]
MGRPLGLGAMKSGCRVAQGKCYKNWLRSWTWFCRKTCTKGLGYEPALQQSY